MRCSRSSSGPTTWELTSDISSSGAGPTPGPRPPGDLTESAGRAGETAGAGGEPASVPGAPWRRTALPITAEDTRRRLGDFALLDVRDEARFAAGHLESGGHVPIEALEERRAELPPREHPILVVADQPEHASRAAEWLARRDGAEVRWLDAPLASLPGGVASFAPATRLWRPAPFLEAVLPLLPRGRAADLAAGSGRDAVFLATHGFEVDAYDHDRWSLERATALATRHGVSVRTVLLDLEAKAVTLPEAAYDVVLCFRFLHRPLFPAIAAALAPGGMLVYETYRVGQERFGRPRRPRFLLHPGELPHAFAGLEVLKYEEPSPTGGPLTARLLARRGPPDTSTAPPRS